MAIGRRVFGTRVERELRNVLKRGGVIAGSSAGASILASYLVRGDPSGPDIVIAKGHEREWGAVSKLVPASRGFLDPLGGELQESSTGAAQGPSGTPDGSSRADQQKK
jgi:hypothetical protein